MVNAGVCVLLGGSAACVGYRCVVHFKFQIIEVCVSSASAMAFKRTSKKKRFVAKKLDKLVISLCGNKVCRVSLVDILKSPISKDILNNPDQHAELPKLYSTDSEDSSIHDIDSDYRISGDDSEMESGSISSSASQLKTSAPDRVTSSSSNRKRHFCIYCKTLYVNIPRHLESVHSNIPEVIKFMSLPKLCPERKIMIDKIRKEGDFQYNTNAVYNKGDLIVCRRPAEKNPKGPEDYVTCPKCKGFMSSKTMYQHYRRCDNTAQKGIRNVLLRGKKLIARYHTLASLDLKERIFPAMRDDEIVRILRYDKLLIIFGNKLCQKYKYEHLNKYIRQILRTLGRVLLAMKEIDGSITDFASILTPRRYDILLEAVNKVGNFDKDIGTYKRPTLVSNIGTYVKKCAKLQVTQCIKEENDVRKMQVQNFLKVLEEDYGTAVNKTAIENQSEQRRKKTTDLPSSEDIEILRNYLEKQREKHCTKLTTEYHFENWLCLANCSLTYIQVFNRRRPGEMERMLISDFKTHHTISHETNTDIYKNLSLKAKHSANNFVRIQIRGKLGRTVSVLLHNNWLKAVDLIIKYRNHAGVLQKNPYVFSIPGGTTNYNHLRACELMRRFASECGAKQPKTIRGTLLRKHIATVVQNLNLNDSDMALLANFMGHDEKIHKSHYRLPVAAKEIGQMTNLLTIIEKGEVNKYKGQNLEQLCCGDSESDDCSDETNTESNHQEQTDQRLQAQTPENVGRCSFQSVAVSEDNEPNKFQNINETTPKKVEPQKLFKQRLARVSPMGKIKRIPWTTPERQVTRQYFDKYLKSKDSSLPHVEDCDKFIRDNPEVQKRSARQVQLWIHNQKKRKLFDNGSRLLGGKNTWTTPEKHVLRNIFKQHIFKMKTPSQMECRVAQEKYSVLKNRSVPQIKCWINNIICKTKRQMKIENN